MFATTEFAADKRSILIDIAAVVGAQKGAFVVCRIVGCIDCFGGWKLGVVGHRGGLYDLVDNLVGELLQHTDWENYVVAAGGMTFIDTAFTHLIIPLEVFLTVPRPRVD